MLFIVFLLITLVPIFIFIRPLKRRYDASLRLKGPHSWPIIGYTKFLTSNQEKLFKTIMDLQKQYDGLYKVWILFDLWVITNDSEVIEKILTDQQFVKSNDYQLLRPWLGTGLLTSDGIPLKILEDFVKVFEKHANTLVEKFRTVQVADVTTYLALFTLDNICETSMGMEINAQNNKESSYAKAIRNLADISYIRMFNPLLWLDFFFNLTKMSKTYKESLEIVSSRTENVIKTRRESLANNKITNENGLIDSDELGRKRKMALIDILLETTVNGEPLSDREIEEEVNTFMFAGHDTTAAACAFLLYNIAKYPHVQEKLVQEIWDILGKDRNIEITMTDLNSLRYLELVIKESLRYHTVVPMFARQILKDTQINQYFFPENTNVTINAYGMCHSENIFPNAELFQPERFETTQDSTKINPFTYIPFSAGPRNCIGQKFALLEIKMMAIKILQNYEISLACPDEELALSVGMVLKSANGIKLKFKARI